MLKFAGRVRSAAVYIPPSLFQWLIFLFCLSRLKQLGISDYRNALWLGFAYCVGAVVLAMVNGVFTCKAPEWLLGTFLVTASLIGLTYIERFRKSSGIHLWIGFSFAFLFVMLQFTHSISTLSITRLILEHGHEE